MTRLLCSIAALILSSPAIACRDVDWSHDQRVNEADVAILAIVTSVSVPELERPEMATNFNASIFAVLADRTIRLAVISTFKGQPDPVISTTVGNCDGGVYAHVGNKVYAYRSYGEWRLKPAPKPHAPAEAGQGHEP